VRLFWYNGNGWKSKKVDEASKKGKNENVKDTKRCRAGREEVKSEKSMRSTKV